MPLFAIDSDRIRELLKYRHEVKHFIRCNYFLNRWTVFDPLKSEDTKTRRPPAEKSIANIPLLEIPTIGIIGDRRVYLSKTRITNILDTNRASCAKLWIWGRGYHLTAFYDNNSQFTSCY